MSTLDLGVFCGWCLVDKSDSDPKANQPEMQHGWEGRAGLIIVEDAIMIEADLVWQTVLDKCPAENQLIV
jgi:hypothetical protein